MPKTERSMLARQARGALAATLLCSALLATGASPAQAQAQAQPAAAQASGQAAKHKAKPVDKAKSTGSAPGDDCSATAGNKVPSWPKKCPGKAKVPAKQ